MANQSVTITPDGNADNNVGDHSVTITQGMGEARQPADQAPQVPLGDTVETTHGTAQVHTRMDGTTIVTLPGGLSMSAAEAEKSGILTPAAPEAPQAETKEAPKATEASDEEAAGDLPTVDEGELALHTENINAIGDAFTAAGLDEGDALDRAVAAVHASDDGVATLPDDVTDALNNQLGDKATEAIDGAMLHAQAAAADALVLAGVDLNNPDGDFGVALARSLDQDPGAPAAFAAALRGNRDPLNALVASHVKTHRNQ